MKLTSTKVIRLKPGDKYDAALEGSPIRSLSDGDYLIGVFRHDDGRTAVMLNNYRFAYTAWPTVEFAADPARITEIDQETGREIPLRDDSPDMEGWQLSIDAGAGRLFLLRNSAPGVAAPNSDPSPERQRGSSPPLPTDGPQGGASSLST